MFVTDDGASAVWVACDGPIWIDNFHGQHHVHVPFPTVGTPVLAADGEHLLVRGGDGLGVPGVYRLPLAMGAVPELLPELPPASLHGYDVARDALWSESVVGLATSVGVELLSVADGALVDRVGWGLDGDQGARLFASNAGLLAGRRAQHPLIAQYATAWFEVVRAGQPNAVLWIGTQSFPEPSAWRFGDTDRFLVHVASSGEVLADQYVVDVEHATLQSLDTQLLFRPMTPLVDGHALAIAPTTGGQLYALDPASASVTPLGGPDLPWAERATLIADFTGVRVAYAACEGICSTAPRPIALVDPATMTITQTDTVYASARLAAVPIPPR